jgi:hypothetical protein
VTPEERAEKTVEAMNDRCAFDPTDEDMQIVASAIRAAENEALERAARIADRNDLSAWGVARAIRDLITRGGAP